MWIPWLPRRPDGRIVDGRAARWLAHEGCRGGWAHRARERRRRPLDHLQSLIHGPQAPPQRVGLEGVVPGRSGGDDRARSHDLLLAKQSADPPCCKGVYLRVCVDNRLAAPAIPSVPSSCVNLRLRGRQTLPTTTTGLRRPTETCPLPGLSVETMGLEPTTFCLQSRCSSQLSYVPEGSHEPTEAGGSELGSFGN